MEKMLKIEAKKAENSAEEISFCGFNSQAIRLRPESTEHHTTPSLHHFHELQTTPYRSKR